MRRPSEIRHVQKVREGGREGREGGVREGGVREGGFLGAGPTSQ